MIIFHERKLKMFVKKFDNFRFYVRPLCELQLFAALGYDIRHHTRPWNSAQRWRSLCPTSPLFQGEDKSIERGENHYKSGHVESFSYADGEIVHASRRERDVTYETCSLSHYFFSLQPLTEQLPNKRSNS